MSRDSEWIGLANFERMFGDPVFWSAVGNTLLIAVLQLVFFFPAPLALALLLHSIAGDQLRILSEPAAAKVKALLDQEGRDDLRLRIAVQPGGCSGLRYQLFFDERFLDGDQTYEYGGVEVIVDRMSGPYLGGATIDFVDTIEKQGFTIDNPNAGGSCACGDSFN